MLVLEDRELIRWCGERGVGVVSYGPLAYGLLAGSITAATTFDRGDHRAGSDLFGADRERSLAVVEAMRPIADRLGVTLAQLAIAWNVHQSGVTSAIAGSRDAAHVAANAAAGDVELDAGTLDELEAVVSLGPSSE
jgi:aryl-alcohol dehydrogenase-like predicted oxidoreductase